MMKVNYEKHLAVLIDLRCVTSIMALTLILFSRCSWPNKLI